MLVASPSPSMRGDGSVLRALSGPGPRPRAAFRSGPFSRNNGSCASRSRRDFPRRRGPASLPRGRRWCRRSRPRPARAGSPCRRATTGCGSDSWASETIPASEPRLPHTPARGCARRWPSGRGGPSGGRRNRTLSIRDRRPSRVRPGRGGRPDWLAWARADSRLWGRFLR